MGSSQIFYKFRKDRFALLRFYLVEFLLMSFLMISLLSMGILGTNPTEMSGLIFVAPGIVCGLVLASLLHNTAHGNIKNKYLNRVVGEICGYWVLYGFQNFVLIHMLHHKFSDEEFDPVNPKGMNFFVFLTAPMRYMIRATKKYLFSIHGKHADYQNVMRSQSVVFNINLILRLSLWFIILGPKLFVFFYLPGIMATIGIFAHINYNCHEENPKDGTVEIVNLNHNLYYKIANTLTFGGYFHKNHHLNPRLFDPRSLSESKSSVTADAFAGSNYIYQEALS